MLKLAGWEPLPSLGILRARAAHAEASRQGVALTSSPVRLHSASVDAARLPEQSFDTVNTAGLTGLLQQEAAVRSAFHTSPHIVPSHPAPCQLCPNSSGMPGARSDHSSELSSEPGRIPLEEGELPDVDEPPQQSQLDEPADEVLLASQQGTAASAAIAISPAPTVKRKRGERAGKRVRQRQARRTRDAHLSLMLTDGAMMLAPQAPKRLCSTKHLPTCKYFLFGKCSKGDQCPFPHAGMPVTRFISCRFFQQGHCAKGEDCPYSHDNKVEPCKQLVLHGACRFGSDCHFSHAPLPAYAVGPLQAWIKEQDQLKLDRSDKQAQEQANNSAHHQATATVDDCGRMSNEDEETSLGSGQGFEDPGNSGSSQQAASIHDQASPQGFACTSSQGRAEPQYSDWTDGWQELFADRLQLRKRRRIVPPDPATFAPLSAPYTSWNDGWQKLFSQNTSPLQHGSVTC